MASIRTSGGYRLTNKGIFMAWRMNLGNSYEVAGAEADAAYPLGSEPDGTPIGEYAAEFIAAHPVAIPERSK